MLTVRFNSMLQILVAVVCAILIVVSCAVGFLARADTNVVVYPEPSALSKSPLFKVEVKTGEGWSESFVNFNLARTRGNGTSGQYGRSFNWTTFETSGPVDVRIHCNTGSFEKVVIRPKRYGITTHVNNGIAELTMQPGQKISVEFDKHIAQNSTSGTSTVTHILMLFADPIRSASAIEGIALDDIYRVTPGFHQEYRKVENALPPTLAGKCNLNDANGRKVVIFGPGVHDIGYWQVPNNIEQIHLEGGAVVYGALDILPKGTNDVSNSESITHVWEKNWGDFSLRSSFKISGPGILSGEKLPWHLRKDFVLNTNPDNDEWAANIKLLQIAATNVVVEDVTLCSSPYWTLSYMNDSDARTKGTLDNFKIVGAWAYNSDGLPNLTGKKSIVSNAFIHANDDSFKIYNSGSTITNCVIWQGSNGSPFQFGWFPKTVQNVNVQHIDVIHFEGIHDPNEYNHSVFNYRAPFNPSSDSPAISFISFADIAIEGRIPSLIGMYTGAKSGQRLVKFRFSNLVCEGLPNKRPNGLSPNYLVGDIGDWNFLDLVVNGAMITSMDAATKLGQFHFSEGVEKLIFAIDSDDDSIPDEYEGEPTPYVVGVDDREVDSDGDSLSNADEYFRGTDPSDPNSF